MRYRRDSCGERSFSASGSTRMSNGSPRKSPLERVRARSLSVRPRNNVAEAPHCPPSRRGRTSLREPALAMEMSRDDSMTKTATNSLLFYAIAENNLELTRKLVSRSECDINDVSLGYSPLHQAAAVGEFDCLAVLLDAGADVNIADTNGRTPLEYAVFAGSFEAASALIEYGADTTAIRNGFIM